MVILILTDRNGIFPTNALQYQRRAERRNNEHGRTPTNATPGRGTHTHLTQAGSEPLRRQPRPLFTLVEELPHPLHTSRPCLGNTQVTRPSSFAPLLTLLSKIKETSTFRPLTVRSGGRVGSRYPREHFYGSSATQLGHLPADPLQGSCFQQALLQAKKRVSCFIKYLLPVSPPDGMHSSSARQQSN